MELYRKGCTLQLHQPQRWNESLWRLIAAMEKQLGCLVGANAYITPAGATLGLGFGVRGEGSAAALLNIRIVESSVECPPFA